MFLGAHVVLSSRDAEADRAFLRDVLKLRNVDAGHGWLIFALPPSEVAVHPASRSGAAMYLMCEDLEVIMARMKKQGVRCGPVQRPRWGILTHVKLPSGSKLGVYQPLHPRPKPARTRRR